MERTIEVERTIICKDSGEDKTFFQEIELDTVQCVYKDRNGVAITLKNGKLIRPDNYGFNQLVRALQSAGLLG